MHVGLSFAAPFLSMCHLWIPSRVPLLLFLLEMNHNRAITILVWNIRGINSQEKCDALRAKIDESAASIVCLQETKKRLF